MYDIFYIAKEKDYKFLNLQKRIPLLKLAKYEDNPGEGFFSAQKKATTKMFWVITDGFKINEDFTFNYIVPEWDMEYPHIFQQNSGASGGLYLIPKKYPITKREAEYNFFVNKKDIELKAGEYPPYDRFVIKTPNDFFLAQQESTTSMFYAIPNDYKMIDNLDFSVPKWDEKYVHMFKEENQQDGIVNLISKNYPITKKEAEYNFFINKKVIEKSITKPCYDKFFIKNSDDFFSAQQECHTSMFYAIDKDYKPTFDFDYIVPPYDKNYVNVFKNDSDEYSSVYLIPKDYPITKNEAKHGFFINKKEIDIVASKLEFDITFISYNEVNANENWEKLKSRFPRAIRVNGIKGIHQAHIAAAEACKTSMFWVVDGDAVIEDTFDFYIKVPKWDRDAVHVFRSRNPINDLTYGYGGVKLLPRNATIDMDINSVDMTTSISKKFVLVDIVSNVTNFNSDPFSTWKSAFRECVKLSSKIIDGQIDEQTQERLDIWCSIGADRPFGEYAIKGAIAGREFGTTYASDRKMLKKINDWKWLENEFRR